MRFIGRILVIILALVGSLTVLLTCVGAFAVATHRPEPLPARMVLQLDLNTGLTENVASTPLARMESDQGPDLREVVEILDRAALDSRVSGLVARFDGRRLTMAQAQEIRDAVSAFGKMGKRTVLYASSFGEANSATVGYYMATAFQEIWMQPSGDLGMTGFMAQSPFFKDTLDMLGVKPEFGARYEYKSAIDVFTQKQFTKESRESLQLLVDSWTRQVVTGIAEARKLDVKVTRSLFDKAPFLADEAQKAGLVDRLAYWDELESDMTGKGVKLVAATRYADRLPEQSNAVKVALIFGTGTVQRGGGDDSLFADNSGMFSEHIGKAFREAVKDPEVKAILFRIDSPGGDYVAADAIWREVGKARAAGKPVIVSMGSVAASGGYFAAMPADYIVAYPGTITGSIGVFSGKMVAADLFKKLGVSFDEIHVGQNAPMWSATQPFSASAWERMNTLLDHVYQDFTTKAVQDRHLKPENIDKIARGRIWPGDEARKVGLVDDLGGYHTAFAAIRQLAHLPSQMPVRLVEFPPPKNTWEYMVDLLHSDTVPTRLSALLALETRLTRFTAFLQPLAELFAEPATQSTLRMPEIQK